MLRKERKIFLPVITTVIGCLIITILPSQTLGENNAALNERLFKAIGNGDITEVQALLAKGAEIEAKDQNGLTPLMKACEWGSVGIVQLLIDHNANLNATNRFGSNPLRFAICSRDKRKVQALLENGADASSSYSGGATPLMLATIVGSVPIARLLLENGAASDSISRKGVDATLCAALLNRKNMLDLLKEYEDKPSMAVAVTTGDIDSVRKFLKTDMHEEISTSVSCALLNYSSRQGHTKVLEMLLGNIADRRSNTNIRQCSEYAFKIAFQSGHIDTCNMLLKEDLQIEPNNIKDFKTDLLHAVVWGQKDMITFALQNGINPNLKFGDGRTFLMNLCRLGASPDFIRMLLKFGANINERDDYGQTALIHTLLGGDYLETATLLLNNGAKVKLRDMDGRSAHDFTNNDFIKSLLQKHSN